MHDSDAVATLGILTHALIFYSQILAFPLLPFPAYPTLFPRSLGSSGWQSLVLYVADGSPLSLLLLPLGSAPLHHLRHCQCL